MVFIFFQTKVKEIQKRLALNTSSLSSTVRRLTSAEDTRPSARGIGYLGLGIISFMLAAIVFIDSHVLFRDVKFLFGNLKHGLCPRWCR